MTAGNIRAGAEIPPVSGYVAAKANTNANAYAGT